MDWTLRCSDCEFECDALGLPTVCSDCGMPLLVCYDTEPQAHLKQQLGDRAWNMWRYREWLPLEQGEKPVSLGEGGTPLIRLEMQEDELGLGRLWVKDESQNPTGSFKARGLSAAVTRAAAAGAKGFAVPTAGNAGVATSAYAARAHLPARVFAPRTTPPRILEQIERFGGTLEVLDGHIGDCGKRSREFARESGAFDLSTLREPYRIEGKKTLGLEIAEQLDWQLPDAIIYPTGGGTGLIGMWKAFRELHRAGWIGAESARLYAVQSSGCAPVVRAFSQGESATEAWQKPETVAAGLRVPDPLGGRLILKAIHESGGAAVAVSETELVSDQRIMTGMGIDAAPEGGATLAGLRQLTRDGGVREGESVVLFNTGAGWLYEGCY